MMLLDNGPVMLRTCFDFLRNSFLSGNCIFLVNALSAFSVVFDCYFRRLAR